MHVQFCHETGAAATFRHGRLLKPPPLEPDNLSGQMRPSRKCYFATLDLDLGNLVLTVNTVQRSTLPPDIRRLRKQFNVKLVGFENAPVSLPPFKRFHYFETLNFLVGSLGKFYTGEFW